MTKPKKEKSKPKTKAATKTTKTTKAKSKKPETKQRKSNPPKAPGVGHNSGGQINKPLKKIFEQYLQIDANKKEMGKTQRSLRAKAKEEHGIQLDVFSHEIRLMKMDQARRVQFETGSHDLKEMLGYQFALPLDESEASEDENTTGNEEQEEGHGEEGTGEDDGNHEDEAA
jgi:cobalamin biosynthesis protein CobT